MSSTCLRINWGTIIGNSIGALVVLCVGWLFFDDKTFIIFITISPLSVEAIGCVYEYYMLTRKSTQVDNSDIGILLATEKGDQVIVNGLIASGNNILVQVGVVVTLAILSRIITSRWILSVAFSLDYLLYQSHQFLNRIYKTLFPSNEVFLPLLQGKLLENTRGWSKSVTIIVALLIDVTEIAILTGMLMVTSIIPHGILYEVKRYVKFLLNSNKNNSSQQNKVLTFFINNIDDYMPYLFSLVCLIGCEVMTYS